ncbi:hypothetical protein ACFY2N_34295 [Streptomyces rubiginosohelvolus]|uniref:hypothetical protein n=1 Tax=Streptomyces rubiginosohelvolus TaxID=67362 RepID=UPI0036C25685
MHQSYRLLAGRYRLTAPVPPEPEAIFVIAEDEHSSTRAQVLAQQIPLPELLSADDSAGLDAGTSAIGQDAAALADTVRAVTRLPLHRNLGEVYDVIGDGDRLWLIQEHITRAKPLAHLLAGGKLTPRLAAEIAADLLRALRHLHRHGWHHGALTPDTVWIDDTGSAVLTGLGQAVVDDLICGIHRNMPLPPSPRPSAPNSRHQRPPHRSSAPPRPATARPTTHGNISGVAGGVHADAQRRTTADAWPPTTVERPGSAPAKDPCPAPSPCPQPPAMTPLEAERALQQRIITVGGVQERWAPEQAWYISDTTPLPAPVGGPADLWALGVLLFRAVHGHPPYPEDISLAELLVAVREEPPAYAEEAGVLRPVIEQLLYADPARRLGAGQALAWLDSIRRDAPEPTPSEQSEAPAPSPLLPGAGLALRFRGPLVRRARPDRTPAGRRARRRPRPRQRPARRTVALTGLVAVTGLSLIGYALLNGRADDRPTAASGRANPPSPTSTPNLEGGPLVRDPAGFVMAVTPGSDRRTTPRGVVFRHGAIVVTVVPGHDRLSPGKTLLDYQSRQPELSAVRADPGSTATDVRLVTVGDAPATAEGTYTWTTADGSRRYARNRAVVLGERVHVLLVTGPTDQRERVDAVYLQGAATYRRAPEASATAGTPKAMSRTLRTKVQVL